VLAFPVPCKYRTKSWVIERAAQGREINPNDETPGSGALMARLSDKAGDGAVPLKHTDVKAGIAGYIATVDVRQSMSILMTRRSRRFMCPAAAECGVNEFVMTIGQRKIRGIFGAAGGGEDLSRGARQDMLRR